MPAGRRKPPALPAWPARSILRQEMGMLASGWVLHVLVPILLGLLVLLGAWTGIRGASSEHFELARSVPLFGRLSDRQVRSLMGPSRAVEFDPGATIIKEGTSG